MKLGLENFHFAGGFSVISKILLGGVFTLLLPQVLSAEQIRGPESIEFFDRAMRFFEMRDHSVRVVALGSVLIGISCGMMGSYVVTRKLSLFGDTLSHAVLPGIAIGFLWAESKDNLALLLGASFAGFLGVACISLLKKFTKISQDSALGIVLSGFYAVGICMLTRIQKMDFGNQSGLDTYLFGQVSALSTNDLIGVCASLVLITLFITLNYKELLISGFDPEYARSVRLPADILQYLLWALLAFCVITSLQVVGVILASALLIIPAASASLLAKRMSSYLCIAASLGAISGLGGAFLSFLGDRLPTGPLIVLTASFLFLLILVFRPHHGILVSWVKSRLQSHSIAMENTLKAIYQVIERHNFSETSIRMEELMQRRNLGSGECMKEVNRLSRSGFATASLDPYSPSGLPPEKRVSLTPKGWEYACRIVRNHRLWELYLTNEARYAPDHVHEDAEKIEHVLGEETVRELERILSNPRRDPHGKLIPSLVDIERGWLG